MASTSDGGARRATHDVNDAVANTSPRLTLEDMVHPVFWSEPWDFGDRAAPGLGGSHPARVRVVDGVSSPAGARPARPEASGPPSGPELPPPAAPGAPGAAAQARPEQERWQQALDELEAAKQRALREGERAKEEARTELVSRLFPVLDGLDRSLASGNETNGLVEGVRLVRAQLAQVLADFGVDRIDAVGRLFDPQEHEAVDVVAVESPSEHNRVVEQWEAGYRHAGRVLRPAKVRVGKVSR
jgi:molecular chaperone GrpE